MPEKNSLIKTPENVLDKKVKPCLASKTFYVIFPVRSFENAASGNKYIGTGGNADLRRIGVHSAVYFKLTGKVSVFYHLTDF
jgi:hypothetical protein